MESDLFQIEKPQKAFSPTFHPQRKLFFNTWSKGSSYLDYRGQATVLLCGLALHNSRVLISQYNDALPSVVQWTTPTTIYGSHGNRPLWNTDGKCPSTQLLPMSVDSDTSQQRSAALMLVKHFPGRAITTSGSTCRQHCEIKLFLKHIWNLYLYNLYPLKLIYFLST